MLLRLLIRLLLIVLLLLRLLVVLLRRGAALIIGDTTPESGGPIWGPIALGAMGLDDLVPMTCDVQ